MTKIHPFLQKFGLQNLSPESRFIGFVVLGFGVVAIISVLLLAFGGINSNKENKIPERQMLAKELIEKPAELIPLKRNDLFFDRNKNFDPVKMNGNWQAAIGKYTAVLQVDKNVFQIILASPDPLASRRYSVGTYKALEDIIMLNPRLDWPAPKSESKRVKYERLTTSPYPVIALYKGGDQMLWQNAPQSEGRVAAPYKSPLMLTEKVDVITWKRLKE